MVCCCSKYKEKHVRPSTCFQTVNAGLWFWLRSGNEFPTQKFMKTGITCPARPQWGEDWLQERHFLWAQLCLWLYVVSIHHSGLRCADDTACTLRLVSEAMIGRTALCNNDLPHLLTQYFTLVVLSTHTAIIPYRIAGKNLSAITTCDLK